MTVVRRHLAADVVGPEKLTASLRNPRYVLETFMQEPLCYQPGTLSLPGGTDAVQNVVDTGRYRFYYTNIGDATDAFVPTLASEGGYNWVLTTATLARGMEVIFGGFKDGHPRNFIPSNEDWVARILLLVDDASGVDLTFGLRKAGAAVASLTEITDVVALRVLGDSSSALAAISIITNLNNAGTSDYVTTALSPALTDASLIELEVRSVGRKARFFINSTEYYPSSEYTFDSGDVMCPFFRPIQTTDLAAQIKSFVFEAGPLEDKQDVALNGLAGATT